MSLLLLQVSHGEEAGILCSLCWQQTGTGDSGERAQETPDSHGGLCVPVLPGELHT